jgi:hypothetical protein
MLLQIMYFLPLLDFLFPFVDFYELLYNDSWKSDSAATSDNPTPPFFFF